MEPSYLGNQGKYDFLEFIKNTGDQLCVVPGGCQTDHDGEYESTHNRHDLRDGKLKYDIRQSFQAFCIRGDGKVRNQ